MTVSLLHDFDGVTYVLLGGVLSWASCWFCPLSFCFAGVLGGPFPGFQSFFCCCFYTSLVSG